MIISFPKTKKNKLILTPSHLSGSGEKILHLSRTMLSKWNFQQPLSGEGCKNIFVFCPLPRAPSVCALLQSLFLALSPGRGASPGGPGWPFCWMCFWFPGLWGPHRGPGLHPLLFKQLTVQLWLSIEAKCQVFLRNQTLFSTLGSISNNWALSLLKASNWFAVSNDPLPWDSGPMFSTGIKIMWGVASVSSLSCLSLRLDGLPGSPPQFSPTPPAGFQGFFSVSQNNLPGLVCRFAAGQGHSWPLSSPCQGACVTQGQIRSASVGHPAGVLCQAFPPRPECPLLLHELSESEG